MSKIRALIKKYHTNTLSEIEKQELNEWIAKRESNRLLFQQLTDGDLFFDELKKVYAIDKEKGWQHLMDKLRALNTKKTPSLKKGNKK